jgi:hypothetical protein
MSLHVVIPLVGIRHPVSGPRYQASGIRYVDIRSEVAA